MAKNTQPVLKRCRTLGVSPAAMGYSKQSNRNPGGKRRTKKSEYGTQLTEKQKVKFVYGILEKQFHTLYEKAESMKGNTGENLLSLVERRLDNVVYRLGLATTRRQARQLVNHGHITVDGKRVDIPSYEVKPGQVISLRERSKNLQVVKDALEAVVGRAPFVSFDENKMEGSLVRLPEREELDANIDEALVVEYYNKL